LIINPTGTRAPEDVSNSLGISTNMDVPGQFHQQTPDHFEKNRGYQHLTHTDAWTDSRCHQLFTILAQNLKPHSPNMFPTTGVARLNWSLEE